MIFKFNNMNFGIRARFIVWLPFVICFLHWNGNSLAQTRSRLASNPNKPKSSPNFEMFVDSNCGCGFENAKTASSRIVGGHEIWPEHRYPWLVPLISEDMQQFCAASIINDRYLLTVAHCFKYQPPDTPTTAPQNKARSADDYESDVADDPNAESSEHSLNEVYGVGTNSLTGMRFPELSMNNAGEAEVISSFVKNNDSTTNTFSPISTQPTRDFDKFSPQPDLNDWQFQNAYAGSTSTSTLFDAVYLPSAQVIKIRVALSAHSLNSSDFQSKLIPVENVLIHRGYRKLTYGEVHDIALIKLSRRISFGSKDEKNKFVSPICLPLRSQFDLGPMEKALANLGPIVSKLIKSNRSKSARANSKRLQNDFDEEDDFPNSPSMYANQNSNWRNPFAPKDTVSSEMEVIRLTNRLQSRIDILIKRLNRRITIANRSISRWAVPETNVATLLKPEENERLRINDSLSSSGTRFDQNKNENNRTHLQYMVAGWGYLTSSGPKSNVPMVLAQEVISRDACETLYGPEVSSGFICAGGEAGKDSCAGDSGGPLFAPLSRLPEKKSEETDNNKRQNRLNVEQQTVSKRAEINAAKSLNNNQPEKIVDLPELKDKTDNFVLLGLVSWGFECGFEEFYGIYTEVRPYLNWVLANTHDATYCTPFWKRSSDDDKVVPAPRPPEASTTPSIVKPTSKPDVSQTGDEPIACGLESLDGVTYPWQVSIFYDGRFLGDGVYLGFRYVIASDLFIEDAINKGVFSLNKLKLRFRRPGIDFKVKNVVTSYLPRRYVQRDYALFEILDLDNRQSLSEQADLAKPLASTGAAVACMPPTSLRLINGQLLITVHIGEDGKAHETLFLLVANRRCKQLAPRFVNRRMICAEKIDTRRPDARFFERPAWPRQISHAFRTLRQLSRSVSIFKTEGTLSAAQTRLTRSSSLSPNQPKLEENDTFLLQPGQPLFARLNGQYFLFGLHIRAPWPFEQNLRHANLALFFNVRRYRHMILEHLKRNYRRMQDV